MIWPSAGFAGGALVVIGALILCVALLISKALSGIFGVALYRYALEGEVLGGFTQEDLESAVKQKRGAKLPPAPPPARSRSMARTAILEAPTEAAEAVLGAMRAVALEHGGPGLTEMDRETIGSAGDDRLRARRGRRRRARAGRPGRAGERDRRRARRRRGRSGCSR